MKCFVIMPFGNPKTTPEVADRQATIYKYIEMAVHAVRLSDGGGVTCHRADQELRPGEIVTHVIENLVTADIVIADLTGRNSNVFYELGVRHAVGNNTILIAQDIEDIPFDLRNQRAITYSYDPRELIVLKETLEKAVGEVIKRPDESDNPVRRYINGRSVAAAVAGAPSQANSEALNDVKAELSSLRRELKAFVFGYREITRAVTSGARSDGGGMTPVGHLSSFEGVWEGDDGSVFCVRVIDGGLFVPYCFEGSTALTGHLYNIRVIGETLFARFEWFGMPISGYIFLKLDAGQLSLSGGWWYSDDVPAELAQDFSKIDTTLPGMNKLVVKRDTAGADFPAWAEEYFAQVETGNLSEEFKWRIGIVNRTHFE